LQEAFIEEGQFFDSVEFEGSGAFVQAGVTNDVPGAAVVEQMVGVEGEVDDFLFEEGVICQTDFSFSQDGFLQLCEGGVEVVCRGLGGEAGGNVLQGGIAVAADGCGEVIFYFEGGDESGALEGKLDLGVGGVRQQQEAECLLKVEVERGQEGLGVEDVAVFLAVVAVGNSHRVELLEVSKDGSSAGAEDFGKFGDVVVFFRLQYGQDLQYSGDSGQFHSQGD